MIIFVRFLLGVKIETVQFKTMNGVLVLVPLREMRSIFATYLAHPLTIYCIVVSLFRSSFSLFGHPWVPWNLFDLLYILRVAKTNFTSFASLNNLLKLILLNLFWVSCNLVCTFRPILDPIWVFWNRFWLFRQSLNLLSLRWVSKTFFTSLRSFLSLSSWNLFWTN